MQGKLGKQRLHLKNTYRIKALTKAANMTYGILVEHFYQGDIRSLMKLRPSLIST